METPTVKSATSCPHQGRQPSPRDAANNRPGNGILPRNPSRPSECHLRKQATTSQRSSASVCVLHTW